MTWFKQPAASRGIRLQEGIATIFALQSIVGSSDPELAAPELAA
jgi:hypothetical protein